jgi:hypothetical protein
MAPRKPQQLAALRIGYQTYLVPAANASKAVELLGEAIEVDDHYGDDITYSLGKPIRLEYKLVRPSQVRRPADAEDEPIRLPLRITKQSGIAGLLPAAQEPLWRKIK